MIQLKTPKQIEGIRKSCKLLAQAFLEILPKIEAGMSTADVNEMFAIFAKKHNCKAAWRREGFPAIACISPNDAVIHGIPSKKTILREGDLVGIDVGFEFDGYISDATRTVQIGKVAPEVARLHEITKKCLSAGIAACKAGNRISDISRAVFEVANAAGFGVVSDFCGHGVGLGVHEDPSVPNVEGRGANPRIKAGMVLAIEPMINLGSGDVFVDDDNWTVRTADGKFSAHEEHTVAVFAERTEVLTVP